MTVQPVQAFSPYSNVVALWTEGLPTWMDPYDAQRVQSYQVYEQIYWNVPDTFKLVFRGEENAMPIYIPTARTIVDTTARYVATNPGFVVSPVVGTPQDQEACRQQYSALFARERFWSLFSANKTYGIMRGDWCFHILANPLKPQGTRIKIEAIDPAAYFPVTHPDDPDRIIAVHIVEQVADPDGNIFVRRQTYQRGQDPINNDGTDTTIWNSVGLFDVEKWQALDDSAITTVKPPTQLPAQITSIPVYHIKNIEAPGDPYGSSELRGLERIMAAINQAISDEELALALEGLGMYETDGGPPRDEAGRVTDWVLGPGRVVEHTPGSKFGRVNGVSSVDPVQNHLEFLVKHLREASGTPDAATGKVDVQVAESGIALVMQLSPLLAKAQVREEPIEAVLNNMFHDLRAWFAAYEGFVTPCIVQAVFGSPLPENRDARVKEILAIYAAGGLVDAQWTLAELAKWGYDFTDSRAMIARALDEVQQRARATDPFASRMEEESIEEGVTGGTTGA